MDKELRQLHLLGATGASRTETIDGKEWLVIPTVALMEGVIHPVNARTAEFVSAAVLEKAAASWNRKPVTLGHPVKNGTQCSANDEAIKVTHHIGEVRNSRYADKKMLQEAWIDVEKAGKLRPEMLADLRANKSQEVSVGAFVLTDGAASTFNNKPYKAAWTETTGDHLAFLYGGRGACSREMGCGTHRAAMHLVTAEAFVAVPDALPTLAYTALAGGDLSARISAVNDAVHKKWNTPGIEVAQPSSYAYAKQVFDSSVIVESGSKYFAVPYDVAADGTVTLGTATEVRQEYVAAARYAECETCGGTGQVKDGESQKDCPTCEGAGELKAAEGRRNSEADARIIQSVHDHAAALGATCETKTAAQKIFGLEENAAITPVALEPQLKAACRCEEESTMDKKVKAEIIAALVIDKHSGFKEGDVAFLETATDARLEEFKAAAQANKVAAEAATKQENDLRAAQAKLTVIESKLKAAEAVPTEEEWLGRAPAGIKALLEHQKAQETELREDLVKQLKAAGANTEEELKAMPTAQLQTLAKYAKVQTPDFSGRGIPAPRFAQDDEDYTPPDPYEPALKALREKTVN